MCSPANCYSCGKTTWAGCGMHVDQVMVHVPVEARCTCNDEQPASSSQGSAFRR
jgi:hypothetical protein